MCLSKKTCTDFANNQLCWRNSFYSTEAKNDGRRKTQDNDVDDDDDDLYFKNNNNNNNESNRIWLLLQK